MAKKKVTPKATKPVAKSKPAASKVVAPKPKVVKKISKRTKWLDNRTETPLIDKYAHKMKSYLKALADGTIDKEEIKEQETILVGLMKEIEPQLDDTLHAKVTQLLCELTVYDIIQMLFGLQEERPKVRFRG